MDTPEVITKLPDQVLREFYDEVAATIPEEKVKQQLEMVNTAKVLQAEGSTRVDGLGQRIASIPARIYMRWSQQYPGCWQDKGFVDAFLADNPECRGPGYRPPQHALRYGKTFLGGKPV